MPTSTQETGRKRRLLLESLQDFRSGVGEAPLVTKWTTAVETETSLKEECPCKESHKQGSPEDTPEQAITFWPLISWLLWAPPGAIK